MKYYFPFLFAVLLMVGCKNTPSSNIPADSQPEDNASSAQSSSAYKECYQFDQRQCMTDKWADNFGLDLDGKTKSKRMKAWLNTQDLKVNRVSVNMNYHEVVCEACDTCPYEHRFFVEISNKGKAAIEKLRLLNLSSCDCSSF